MSRSSLLRRLMWLVAVPIVLVWLATGAWIAARTLHETREMFDEELLRTAASVLAVIPSVLDVRAAGSASGTDRIETDGDGGLPAITVRDASGRILLHSSQLPVLAFDPGQPHFHSIVHQQRRWRVYQRWDVRQHFWIQVAAPLDQRDELLRHLAQAVLVPLLGLLVLLPLAIALGLRFGLAPLRRLSRAIGRNPAQTPILTSDDIPRELAPLTRALDALVASLAQTLDRERRFTADAAHELRHPLAVLRIELDLTGASAQADERRLHLQRAHAGLARMERLVAQLLALARVENLAQLEDAAPVALHELAGTLLRECSQRALLRGVELSLDVQGDASVHGSEGLLAIAIQNVLDNAIRHARSAVAVEIACHGERVDIAIGDDGAGFDEEQLPRLGERFHRPLGSVGAGSGLGLSIARAVVALHQGDIVLGLSRSGGGQVVLRLPRISDAGAASLTLSRHSLRAIPNARAISRTPLP